MGFQKGRCCSGRRGRVMVFTGQVSRTKPEIPRDMHLKLGGKLPRFKGKSVKVPGERPGYLVTYPRYVYTSAAEHNDMTVIDSQPYAINCISRRKILYRAMQSFWSIQKLIWSSRCRVIACLKAGSTQT